MKLASLALVLFLGVVANAQTVSTLNLSSSYPNFITGNLDGTGISGTISADFLGYWSICRPCSETSSVPMRLTRDNLNPLTVRSNLNLNGSQFPNAVGWLEVDYQVPDALITKSNSIGKRLRFSRVGNANVRLRLWRNDNDFPNATPIVDQTLNMSCVSFLNLSKRYLSPGGRWQQDLQSNEWRCAAGN